MKRKYYDKPTRIEKLSESAKADIFFDLINAFSLLKTPIDSANFLQDLLTAGEIKNLAVRLRIARLLLKGETYQEVMKSTHSSSATITKVSMWLAKGGQGFKKVIANLPDKIIKPRNLPKGPIEYHLPEAIFGTLQEASASRQRKLVDEFSEAIVNKKRRDVELQERVDEEYISRKSL